MTTQTPHPPPQPAYPTAPPWANPVPAQATPVGAEQPPPYIQTGQLLVPYPEEMQNASRPTPPRWWPVAIWTFFFSALGVVSAARRATMARRGGNSAAPYWITWVVTMAIGGVFWTAAGVAAVPAYVEFRENALTKQLEGDLRTDGALAEKLGVKANSADCEPIDVRDAGGVRAYDCVLALEDGRTGALRITTDSDGNWTIDTTKKKKK